MWNWMRVLAVGLFALTISACGGGGEAEQTEGPPPFDIKLMQVEQWSALDTQVPDGQYVVLTMKVKNQSNATKGISPWDFEIQNITTNPAEQYSQASEAVGGPFYTAYGPEKYKLLLDNAEHTIHPRMEVERYIVFQLPKEANMARYQLYYKPQDLKLKLEGDDTEITDHREDAGSYSEEEPAEEPAEEAAGG